MAAECGEGVELHNFFFKKNYACSCCLCLCAHAWVKGGFLQGDTDPVIPVPAAVLKRVFFWAWEAPMEDSHYELWDHAHIVVPALLDSTRFSK